MQEAAVSGEVLPDPSNFNTLNSVGGSVSGASSTPETGLQITGYTAVISTTQATASTISVGAAGVVGGTYSEVGAGASFTPATYDTAANLPDSGWWYDPRFTGVSSDLFGGSATNLADPQIYSTIKRVIGGTSITEASTHTSGPLFGSTILFTSTSWPSGYNPNVEKPIEYPASVFTGAANAGEISGTITRNSSSKAIVFDRPPPTNSYVEFKSIGISSAYPSDSGVNKEYYQALYPNFSSWSSLGGHSDFFNGDEIHIQFELKCYATIGSSTQNPTKTTVI